MKKTAFVLLLLGVAGFFISCSGFKAPGNPSDVPIRYYYELVNPQSSYVPDPSIQSGTILILEPDVVSEVTSYEQFTNVSVTLTDTQIILSLNDHGGLQITVDKNTILDSSSLDADTQKAMFLFKKSGVHLIFWIPYLDLKALASAPIVP